MRLSDAVSGVSSPLPLLVVRRGDVVMDSVAAAYHDPRLEVITVGELTSEWVSFANRTSLVLVASLNEPLAGLLYALTAGIHVPVLVAAPRHFSSTFPLVRKAGGAGCLSLPLTRQSVDRLVSSISAVNNPSVVGTGLRLLLDPVARTARYRGHAVRLTQREFALLHCLSAHVGHAVAIEDLHRYVWGDSSVSGQQILAVYVCQLRAKLACLGLRGSLKTVRGFGYTLLRPSEREL
jgi:hypothetical protein